MGRSSSTIPTPTPTPTPVCMSSTDSPGCSLTRVVLQRSWRGLRSSSWSGKLSQNSEQLISSSMSPHAPSTGAYSVAATPCQGCRNNWSFSFRGPISELPPDFSSRVEEGFQEKWGAFQLGSFSSHSWTPDILQQAPCCQRLPRDREWPSQVIHGVDSSSPPEGGQRSTRSHTGPCRKASRPADKHTHTGLKYFYYLNYMLSHSIMCSSMHIVINITTF